MGMKPVATYAGCLMILAVAEVWAQPGQFSLRQEPREEARVVALLFPTDQVEVVRIQGDWVEVRHGELQAWMELNDLWKVILEKSAPGGKPHPSCNGVETRSVAASGAAWAGDAWNALVDFVGGNYELSRKMSDPSYRHRIVKVSSEWGPFYYQKTRQYYVKGLHLGRWWDGRICLSLAKRRFHYREVFGGMWSDEFLEAVLRSNHGWLRNRQIFGRGREYLIEVSYHF